MRTISKTEPQGFERWKAQTSDPAGTGACAFDQKPSAVAAGLRRALHDEQCGLDAYTGERIRLGDHTEPNGRRDGDTFHAEHMYPQEHCTPAETVDYANLVGCKPGGQDRPQHPDYGARYKDTRGWPDPAQRSEFVRPTLSGAEGRFRYEEDGTMRPVNSDDGPAKRTIEMLNLNVVVLKENRAAAFASAINHGELNADEARRLLRSIERREAERSRLRPFSFVQKQALQEHIASLTDQ